MQSTGAERSLAPIHVVKINTPYSQHMTGGARQGEEHGEDQDTTDMRRDRQHAKNINAKLGKMFAKTKTRAKKHAKDPAKKLVKTLTGKLAKDLDKRYAKTHTEKLANPVLKNKTKAKGAGVNKKFS